MLWIDCSCVGRERHCICTGCCECGSLRQQGAGYTGGAQEGSHESCFFREASSIKKMLNLMFNLNYYKSVKQSFVLEIFILSSVPNKGILSEFLRLLWNSICTLLENKILWSKQLNRKNK